MSLYAAIDALRNNPPKTEIAAQAFLDDLPQKIQEQLICALYLGRQHLHSASLRSDVELSCGYTKHIVSDEYAQILYEKSGSIPGYLDKLLSCAAESEFDLNAL